jgi:DNA primase
MKTDGLSFVEALKFLASRYGIQIPEREMTPEQKRRLTERERLYAVNSLAQGFFRENLISENGKNARAYLKKRAVDDLCIEKLGIGFAPDSWDSLLNFLKAENIDQGTAEKAGLTVKGKSSGFYDRFRNRITFPIYDISGRITGFGGRVLDDSKPKYLNSPETLIYHKGKSLYGLNLAREKARSDNTIFISEGYLDIAAFHQFGITNAVATLGTALTSDQVRILKGYASRMILVYDSDEAGRSAAARSAGVFLGEGVDAYVLLLPDGHDPDSFLKTEGVEGFLRVLESKDAILDFFVDEGIRKHGVSVAGRMKVLDDVCAILSPMSDRIERDLYAKQAAARLGIEHGAMLERLGSKKRPVAGHSGTGSPETGHSALGSGVRGYDAENVRMEKMIVSMLLQFSNPDIMEEIRKRNLVEYFSDEALKYSAIAILETYSLSSGSNIASDILGRIDERFRGFLAELAVSDQPWTYEGCMGLINQFQSKFRKNEDDLLERIKMAESANDHALLFRLLKEKQLSVKQRRT